MKRVLIPVDGSDCSLRAVDYVIAESARQAKPDEVEAHLLNVQVALRGDIGQFINHEQIAAYQREESEKALGEAQARLNAAAVRVVVHTEVGHVAEVIARLAGEIDCDHVVMGTHGRGALADLLVGSTTIRVVHLARVPVVLVK
jgi:nucleotide-binding universal stress UspA family protein